MSMLSRGMAIVFLFRCIILLVLIGIVFFTMMETYNGVLIKISSIWMHGSITLRNFGSDIQLNFMGSNSSESLYLNSFTLYFGMIFSFSVIFAAVGISIFNRIFSFLMMFFVSLVLQVSGIVYVAHCLGNSRDPNWFAVGWVLFPTFIVAVWVYFFWFKNTSNQ